MIERVRDSTLQTLPNVTALAGMSRMWLCKRAGWGLVSFVCDGATYKCTL